MRRLYRPSETPLRMGEKPRSSEFWIPLPIRSRMMMRNLQVLKINLEGQNTCREALRRVSGPTERGWGREFMLMGLFIGW